MPHLSVRKRGLILLVAVAAALLPMVTSAPAQAAREPKIVYLTFDDGPNAENSPQLLKVLHRNQVPATFFVLGQYLAPDPDYATRLWLAGHAVGNHTWSHPDLTLLDPMAVQHQLASTQRLMGPGAGQCMRPPYGATNAGVSWVATGLGLKQVRWTVDPQDWAHQDSTYIADHVLTYVRDRSIVLLHDGGGPRAATISAVKRIIPALRAQGYEFRTVPACRVPLPRGEAIGMAKSTKPKQSKPVDPTPTDQPSPSPSTPTGAGA